VTEATEATGRPRRGRPGHDREAVRAAAAELFIRKGYDATSVGDIADSLGLTKSAFYHHVASKEELLADLLDEALRELEATVAAAGEGPGPASERLRATVARSVEVLVDHQPAVTLLLRVHGNSDTEVAALRRRRAIDRRLADLVSRAAQEGEMRGDLDPDVVSRLVFGMVNSLVEWYSAQGQVPRDELAATVTALVFDGLARAGRG
jgi:AcrR family transcriptional regulator